MAEPWSWPALLWLSGAVTVGLQLVTFIVAFAAQIDLLTDISGASNFVLLGWLTYGLGAHPYPRQTANTVLLTIWALRLGFYLLARVFRRGHDARFDEMRASFARFGGFFVFQACWAFLVTLPVILLNGTRNDVPIGIRDCVGWVFWGVGFVVEVVADQSKDNFYQATAPAAGGSRRIITSGVWAWSRHPNYAGEIFLWLGLFLTCSTSFDKPNNLPGAYAAAALSPAFTFLILMYFSGTPLAEQRNNARYVGEAWYVAYRAQTSPLIPLPPAVYRALPLWVKRWFLFEWDAYAQGLPAGSRLRPHQQGSPTNTTPLHQQQPQRPTV